MKKSRTWGNPSLETRNITRQAPWLSLTTSSIVCNGCCSFPAHSPACSWMRHLLIFLSLIAMPSCFQVHKENYPKWCAVAAGAVTAPTKLISSRKLKHKVSQWNHTESLLLLEQQSRANYKSTNSMRTYITLTHSGAPAAQPCWLLYIARHRRQTDRNVHSISRSTCKKKAEATLAQNSIHLQKNPENCRWADNSTARLKSWTNEKGSCWFRLVRRNCLQIDWAYSQDEAL